MTSPQEEKKPESAGEPKRRHLHVTHPPGAPEHRAGMVHWLHPAQLLRTGLDALVSIVFGTRADARLLEAVVRPQKPYFDYSEESPEGDFWLDYTADTGDGWDSTYTVARLLALPRLEVAEAGGEPHVTERGRLLVLGGDEVYPSASREAYQQRFVQPFEAAMKRSHAPHPDLFVIPGNHDWYDGLSAFMRLFCAQRWIAGRKTRQTRSYFALKLPRGWWLLGTDVQLNSDIDVPQVEYFRQVTEHMKPDDRIILCNAEPAWILDAAGKKPRGYLENNLEYLQEKVLGRRISLFLAGDLHHYRRHEDPEGRQKITAGGGGAYTHPTHAPAVPRLRDGYVVRKSFPDEETSRRLARGNLALLAHSPLYGLQTATIYLLLALVTYADVSHLGVSRLGEVLGMVLSAIVSRPWTLVVGGAVVGTFVALADPAYRRLRVLVGTLHGLVHVLMAFLVAWGTSYFIAHGLGLCPELVPGSNLCTQGWLHTVARFALSVLLIFAGGWGVGSFVTGIYLWFSVNFFGTHSNEAFISLSLPDWKNILRLRIDQDGELTVYPVGIERVARRWKPGTGWPYSPAWEPDDPRATEPLLIEKPVRVTPRT